MSDSVHERCESAGLHWVSAFVRRTRFRQKVELFQRATDEALAQLSAPSICPLYLRLRSDEGPFCALVPATGVFRQRS